MSFIDLVGLVFTGSVFYGGFWCGNKFGTLRVMASTTKAAVKAWF